jgi:hypothetical protein
MEQMEVLRMALVASLRPDAGGAAARLHTRDVPAFLDRAETKDEDARMIGVQRHRGSAGIDR